MDGIRSLVLAGTVMLGGCATNVYKISPEQQAHIEKVTERLVNSERFMIELAKRVKPELQFGEGQETGLAAAEQSLIQGVDTLVEYVAKGNIFTYEPSERDTDAGGFHEDPRCQRGPSEGDPFIAFPDVSDFSAQWTLEYTLHEACHAQQLTHNRAVSRAEEDALERGYKDYFLDPQFQTTIIEERDVPYPCGLYARFPGKVWEKIDDAVEASKLGEIPLTEDQWLDWQMQTMILAYGFVNEAGDDVLTDIDKGTVLDFMGLTADELREALKESKLYDRYIEAYRENQKELRKEFLYELQKQTREMPDAFVKAEEHRDSTGLRKA